MGAFGATGASTFADIMPVARKAYLGPEGLKTYKIKTDLLGHTDEVYCVGFVADKVVNGGRYRTVTM